MNTLQNKKRKLRKGLSLVEIVAVVALIAIITLVAMARFSNANESARVATLDSTFNTVVSSLHLHAAANGGEYPLNWGDLSAHLVNTDIEVELFERIGTTANPVEATVTFGGQTGSGGVPAGHVEIVVTMKNLTGNYDGRNGEFDAAAGTYTLTYSTEPQ